MLSHMGTTITIRTASTLRSLLEERAAATGKSISELVREILERALAEHSTEERAGHLKGRISLTRRRDEPWRRRLRARNWRP
jgi:metal-responsive CopG/Arc/MetJ family transcriptional regulator